MSNKIKALIGLNVVLAVAVLFSLLSTTPESSVAAYERFALTDSASVSQINIGGETFERVGQDSWRLNNEFDAQPSMLRSLLTVLSRLEVKRPAPENQIDKLKEMSQNEGLNVKVVGIEGDIQKFEVLEGDDNTTYATKNGERFYELYIPGYDFDLYDFLNIDTRVWRDRRVLMTDWRNLKSLEMTYNDDPVNSFKIQFDSVFFRIEGVNKLDSAKVFAFIQQFQDFSIMRYAPEEDAFKNTLRASEPFLTIDLKNLASVSNNRLQIYPSKSDTIYAISAQTEELVLLNRQMLNRFLVAKSEFEKRTP